MSLLSRAHPPTPTLAGRSCGNAGGTLWEGSGSCAGAFRSWTSRTWKFGGARAEVTGEVVAGKRKLMGGKAEVVGKTGGSCGWKGGSSLYLEVADAEVGGDHGSHERAALADRLLRVHRALRLLRGGGGGGGRRRREERRRGGAGE
eukprot:1531568-Rhodomonas_salina.1